MTKSELIKEIVAARRALGLKTTTDHVRLIVDDVLRIIARELADGNKVELIGFGTFDVRKRNTKKGRNPRTGEDIAIEPRNRVFFKTGRLLRQAVNHQQGAKTDD